MGLIVRPLISTKSACLILILLFFLSCYPHQMDMTQERQSKDIFSDGFRVYDGLPLPDEKVGIIDSVTKLLMIMQVDDIDILRLAEAHGYDWTLSKKLHLLPGEYNVNVHGQHVGTGVNASYIMGSWILNFRVEPGHKYLIDYETLYSSEDKETYTSQIFKKNPIKAVFIRDKETKNIVSKEVIKR